MARPTTQTDTLRYQLGQRPGTMARDMRHVHCRLLARQMRAYMAHAGKVRVEHNALSFYLLNHAVAEAAARVGHPDKPLGKYKDVFDMYHLFLAAGGIRLFYYLVLICTREARHIRDNGANSAFLVGLKKTYGPVMDWFENLPSNSSDAANRFLNYPPDTQIGVYADLLCTIFYKGSWGLAFGGPKWGVVADSMRAFVFGEITLQVLLDTGYTLCHNGGPIFNKGMLYEGYNKAELMKILNVQDSGQIPQLIASGGSGMINESHTTALASLYKCLGPCMAGTVDWGKVSDKGMVPKMTSKKVTSPHTPLSHPSYKNPLSGLDYKKYALKGAKTFDVMPGVSLAIVQKVRATT